MIVQVENIGNLEFPDGTDSSVIQKTVNNLISEKKADEPTFMDKYLPSVKRTGEIYQEEVKSSIDLMNKAFEKPTGKNIIHGFLGALGYGFSPLTAFAKGMIGEPVEKNLENAGVPKVAAKFVGEMAENAAYFLPYGKAVQTAVTTAKTLEEAKMAEKVVSGIEKSLKTTSKALKFPEGMSEGAIKEAQKPVTEAAQKALKTPVVENVVKELKVPIGELWEPSKKKITQEIVDYITSNPKEIEKVASTYKLAPEELAAQIKETMTLAGRDMSVMGRLAKELKVKFRSPYMVKLSEAIQKDLPEVTVMDKFGKTFRTVENVRRAALVSQFATTMRNIISQGSRVTLGSIDDAFQGAANAYLKSGGEGIFNSVKSSLKGLGEGLDLFTATINRLRPSQRKKLLQILETENAISAKAKMFTTPVQDVMLTGKMAKTLNYFNTTQEYFFRNIAFEAKLRQLSRSAGLDLNALKATDLPEEMLKQAAEYSLEMTFAAMPKSKFGKDFVTAMSNPVVTAVVNPFPRFLYGNALPFLKNFSPIGFLEAVRPSVVADIVSGNPERFTKAITQASLGTIMLNTAMHIRNSDIGGEKWYEIKVGDKRYDTRAFAPFSTYLFIAESMQNPEKIKPADFASALLSLNRVAGTGLVLADMMRSKDFGTTINNAKKFVGSYLSGFSVPVKTVKDLYSYVDPEEKILRDVKENELIGPTQKQIPVWSQKMPPAYSPLKKGKLKTESPVLRQFTGLSYNVKTDLQKEVDRIQIPYAKIYPGTGDAKGDRMVIQVMSNILDKAYPLLEKTNYKQMDETTQRIVLSQLFTDTKKEARNIIMKSNPELALKIKIDALSDDVTELLRKKGVLPQ